MADLSPSQRSTLVKNIRETFGIQIDGKKPNFEVDGVTVMIGADRRITLSGPGGTKTLPGSDFTGRGFTGGMVGAISLAVKELKAADEALPEPEVAAPEAPASEAPAPEAPAPKAATPAAPPAPPAPAPPRRKRRRAMQGDREFSAKS